MGSLSSRHGPYKIVCNGYHFERRCRWCHCPECKDIFPTSDPGPETRHSKYQQLYGTSFNYRVLGEVLHKPATYDANGRIVHSIHVKECLRDVPRGGAPDPPREVPEEKVLPGVLQQEVENQ